MRFRSSVLSECGPARPLNADAVIADDRVGFYGVADGIGSESASAEASAWALMLAHHHFHALRDTAQHLGLAPLFAAVRRDYHTRFGVGVDIPGTTLSIVAVMHGALHCLNVGDSPIFALLEDGAVLLSSRHTVADRDRIVHDMWTMKELPRSNLLDNYLGRVSAEPRLRMPIPLSHGVRIMLCSDGLLEIITSADLLTLNRHSESPTDLTAAIAERAARVTARDNYSAVVVDIDPVSAPRQHGYSRVRSTPKVGPGVRP